MNTPTMSDAPSNAATPSLNSSSCSESDLLRALRSDDGLAFEILVRQYGGQLLAVARRILQCEQDSADVVQDALLSAFQGIKRFAGESSLGTWLYRILVNAALMRLRARKRRHSHVPVTSLFPRFGESEHHLEPPAPWIDQPERQLAEAETRALVREQIDRLPDDFRSVLVLRDIEELDTQQVAEILDVSPGAVKTRLHRARQALRSLLAPHFVEEAVA